MFSAVPPLALEALNFWLLKCHSSFHQQGALLPQAAGHRWSSDRSTELSGAADSLSVSRQRLYAKPASAQSIRLSIRHL